MTIKPCCAKSSLADDLDGLRIAQRTDGSNVQYAITRFTANAHLAQASPQYAKGLSRLPFAHYDP